MHPRPSRRPPWPATLPWAIRPTMPEWGVWPTAPALVVAAGDAPRNENPCVGARGPARPIAPTPKGQLGASRLHGFPHFPTPLAQPATRLAMSARLFSRLAKTNCCSLPAERPVAAMKFSPKAKTAYITSSPRLRWTLKGVFARLLRAPWRLAAPHLPACSRCASTRVSWSSFPKFFAPNLLHLLHETAILNDTVQYRMSLFFHYIFCKTLLKKGLFWDLKSLVRKDVPVRVRPRAPSKSTT